MRCHEAENKIAELSAQSTTSGNKIDDELTQHLNECPNCFNQVKAQQLLNESFADISIEDSAPTPFPFIEQKLRTSLAKQSRKETIMSELLQKLKTSPKMSMGLTVAIVGFLFVLLVPFTYHKTIGYNVTFADVDKGTINDESTYAQAQGQYIAALSAMGIENVSVSHSFGDVSSKVFISGPGLTSKEDAKRAAIAFNKITGNKTQPNYDPIVKEVSGTLFAQAREKYFAATIEVDTDGKTDAEISAEIETYLLSQGATDANVETTTLEDGSRQIQIQIESDN